MKDCWFVALCNILYKLTRKYFFFLKGDSKVLVSYLKVVLPKCISDTQSAFVPGHSILDNAMVAIEVIHFMKTKTRVRMDVCPVSLTSASRMTKWIGITWVMSWSRWVSTINGFIGWQYVWNQLIIQSL